MGRRERNRQRRERGSGDEKVQSRYSYLSFWRVLSGWMLVILHVTWLGAVPLRWLAVRLGLGRVGVLLALNVSWQVLLLIGLLAVLWPALWLDLRRFCQTPVRALFRSWISGCVLMYMLASAGGMLGETFFPGAGASENQQGVELLLHVSAPAMVLLAVVLGPVVEELLYRMLVCRTLSRIHPVIGVAGSSLLFALIHVRAELLSGGLLWVGELLPYLGLGLALGIIYTREKNIVLPILVHLTWNAAAVVLLMMRANG